MTVLEQIKTRTNPDPNSQAAASKAKYRFSGMRMEILRSIYRQPDFWSCERFDVRKAWLHQSTSAQLNSLWRAGLLTRDKNHVRMTYANTPEYIYEIPDWLRAGWDGYESTLEDVLVRNRERLTV